MPALSSAVFFMSILQLVSGEFFRALRMKSGEEGKNYPVLEPENTLPKVANIKMNGIT